MSLEYQQVLAPLYPAGVCPDFRTGRPRADVERIRRAYKTVRRAYDSQARIRQSRPGYGLGVSQLSGKTCLSYSLLARERRQHFGSCAPRSVLPGPFVLLRARERRTMNKHNSHPVDSSGEYIYIHIHIYTHIYIYTHTHMYMYIYI